MKRTRTYTTPCRHAYDYIGRLPPTIMDLRKVVYHLVEGHSYEISELHFYHRLITFQAQTQCSANDRAFTKRCVSHPLFSKLVKKPFGDFECATIAGNILSHQHQVRVLLHTLVQTI